MIRKCIFLVILYSIFLACQSTDTSGPLTPEELVQGTWKLQEAVIDGNATPITTPGLGQIRLIVNDNEYTYVVPGTDAMGNPNGTADSLSGTWSFNDDYSVFTLSQNALTGKLLDWNVTRLSIGTFATRFQEVNPLRPDTTAIYEFTYRLDN